MVALSAQSPANTHRMVPKRHTAKPPALVVSNGMPYSARTAGFSSSLSKLADVAKVGGAEAAEDRGDHQHRRETMTISPLRISRAASRATASSGWTVVMAVAVGVAVVGEEDLLERGLLRSEGGDAASRSWRARRGASRSAAHGDRWGSARPTRRRRPGRDRAARPRSRFRTRWCASGGARRPTTPRPSLPAAEDADPWRTAPRPRTGCARRGRSSGRARGLGTQRRNSCSISGSRPLVGSSSSSTSARSRTRRRAPPSAGCPSSRYGSACPARVRTVRRARRGSRVDVAVELPNSSRHSSPVSSATG